MYCIVVRLFIPFRKAFVEQKKESCGVGQTFRFQFSLLFVCLRREEKVWSRFKAPKAAVL